MNFLSIVSVLFFKQIGKKEKTCQEKRQLSLGTDTQLKCTALRLLQELVATSCCAQTAHSSLEMIEELHHYPSTKSSAS